jgi:hypothetical protein
VQCTCSLCLAPSSVEIPQASHQTPAHSSPSQVHLDRCVGVSVDIRGGGRGQIAEAEFEVDIEFPQIGVWNNHTLVSVHVGTVDLAAFNLPNRG